MKNPDTAAVSARPRRWLRAVPALVLAIAAGATLSARGDDFDNANTLFEQGKFSEAKHGYEELLGRGQWSANLFFNLGDTEFRLGQPGRAALHFERALALEPAHPEALANLQLVRQRSGSRVADTAWFERIFPRISLDGFAIAAALSFWLGVVILVRIILLKGRAGAGLVLGAVAAALAAVYAATPLVLHRNDDALAVIIPAKQAEARLAPADRAGLAEILPPGSRVHVLSERGEWTYCRLPGNSRGWLPTASLEKVRLGRS